MNGDGNISGAPGYFEVVRKVKRKPLPLGSSSNWLTTFADMVTLLLTFLVLLISVTTFDPRTMLLNPEGVSEPGRDEVFGSGVLLYSDRGLMAPVIELLEKMDQLPEDVMFDQSEIKQAVFQLDPAKVADFEELQAALDEGVEIYKDDRGLVVQWDRSLLFDEGRAEILEQNLPLLDRLAVFLQNVSLPLSIEGHTNPLSQIEGGYGPESYELSFARAKAVMNRLASLGVAERRLRIAGLGGTKPRTPGPEAAWENSRLEIVIYKPPQGGAFSR